MEGFYQIGHRIVRTLEQADGPELRWFSGRQDAEQCPLGVAGLTIGRDHLQPLENNRMPAHPGDQKGRLAAHGNIERPLKQAIDQLG
jgi:hypothetical protein